MNKATKKINTRIKRLRKWQEVRTRLSDFEGLFTSFDGLTPHEVSALRRVHRKLYEAYVIAKENEQEVKHELQFAGFRL